MNKYIGSTPVVTQVDGYNRAEADAEKEIQDLRKRVAEMENTQ